jgi:predicted phosphate transport protein (TIGR00153 family)
VRIRLTPQNREFFELFARASANVVEIARSLVELLDRVPDDGRDLIARIKEHEHAGDRVTHEVVNQLNRTFVTPFERDDIFRLASALDDICDHVDEAAGNLELYGIREVPERARAQADVILRSATELDAAVRRLEGFKDSSQHLDALHDLEDQGDVIQREAVAELFRRDNAIEVIALKDIHDRLEEAVDACQSAGDVLEAILVKNR